MQLSELSERSEQAREKINSELGQGSRKIAIFPGTGWKHALDGHPESQLSGIAETKLTIPYSELGIPGADGKIAGHNKSLDLVGINGQEVLRVGRVHANENGTEPDITFSPRIIMEGIQDQVQGLMITNGAGTLDGKIDTGKGWLVDLLINWCFEIGGTIVRGGKRPAQIKEGDIAIINDVVSLLMGQNTPLAVGEFVDPYHGGIHMDGDQYYKLGRQILGNIQGMAPEAIYTMITGPQFEGQQDKRILKLMSDLIGMSTLVEILLATRMKIPFIAYSLATNGPFVFHDHKGNTEVGVREAPKAQRIIEAVVDQFPGEIERVKLEKENNQ